MSKKCVIAGSSFQAGQIISIKPGSWIMLPLDTGQTDSNNNAVEALCIKTKDGFQIIPRVVDVKKIYIEATTVCNFACTTCIRNSWRDELTHMEWGVFKRIAESLKLLPQLECVHFGGFGEPFSHPRLLDMLEIVKNRGLRAEVITNGSLLSAEIISKLIDLKLDMIFVSLDGPDEEEYCHIRQGADFHGVLSNLKMLNEIKAQRGVRYPELGIEFVATKNNFHKLPRLAKLVRELNARRMIVTNVLPYNEEMKDQILYDMDDTGVLFGNDSALLMMQAQMPYMKLRTERYCKFIEDKALVVNHKGFVAPCYALMHSYNCYIYGRIKEIYPFYLGNVTKKLLDQIWIEPAFINFRRTVNNFRFPSCTDCKFLDGCSYVDNNEGDCWGNSPSCAECLWSRHLIVCP
ncbi:tungsten cofactor oxidoreductase radical SAM maturase [Desulfohalotomaculum tongense]|uniref:tungsten cofactor oxidoreductase radical SAM maturase n=1 Tax=Desulforadius tongensis TaxID=1216062 RepID=UPI001958D500|nr:tungsten cofactor oxidoreductase radical SAM maturase [Desulforadius tongensis]MBM7855838.1 tungsten cofactor oxidoreductase radical SAM maturase [Desulforadius tongensis]